MGEIILYHEQDDSRWNKELIQKGVFYLHEAATGNGLSTYHLEATIAYWHTFKEDTTAKWKAILDLYDQLLLLHYTPVAALNRGFALSKVKGNVAGIKEAEKLDLSGNRFYHTLVGELYKEVDPQKAAEHLMMAVSLTKSDAEKKVLEKLLLNVANKQSNCIG